MASIISSGTTSGTALNMTADTSGQLQLATGASATTAVTIDTSQNVGIGTTSPSYKLSLQTALTGTTAGSNTLGSFYSNGSGYDSNIRFGDNTNSATMLGYLSGNMYMYTGGAERMRIDTSGNVLVATTNAAENAGPGIKLAYSTTDPTVRVVANSATSGNSGYILYNTNATNNGYRFYVTYSGVVNAVTTTIAGISDQRFKENIKDLDDGLDAVLALKPRKFDWKEGKGANTKNARGFIAQEFETVFPDLVNEWLEPAPEGEEPYKSVRADLIPTLVKAIQEQQTIINDLKARITALEGAK